MVINLIFSDGWLVYKIIYALRKFIHSINAIIKLFFENYKMNE